MLWFFRRRRLIVVKCLSDSIVIINFFLVIEVIWRLAWWVSIRYALFIWHFIDGLWDLAYFVFVTAVKRSQYKCVQICISKVSATFVFGPVRNALKNRLILMDTVLQDILNIWASLNYNTPQQRSQNKKTVIIRIWYPSLNEYPIIRLHLEVFCNIIHDDRFWKISAYSW